MDQNLETNSIKNLLADQEKRKVDISKELKESEEKAQKCKADLSAINKVISMLEDELSKLGVSIKHEPFGTIIGIESDTGRPMLSASYTLKLISESTKKNGPQTKDIIDQYSKVGISTHGRQIMGHFNDLINQQKIYQTNPDAQRSKRFKVIEKPKSESE